MNTPAARPGSLTEIGFPELLKQCFDGGWSGNLVVRSDDIEKSVSFQDGRLVFARSNNPNDRLGEFLLRRGLITLRQYLESSRQIAPGRRQGAILCEMGAISADDLFLYVKEQVSEIIASLFQWRAGHFELHPGVGGQLEAIVLSIPMEDVILQGIRRVTDWPRVWRGIGGSVDGRFARTPAGSHLGYRVALTQDEAHVLSLVGPKLDLGRVLELSFSEDFDTCRILWALLLVGAISHVDASTVTEAGVEDYELADLVEVYAEVFRLIHGFANERLGDVVDHLMDRVVATVSTRHGDALQGVHMRNQGRVEYEQLLANLGNRDAGSRRAEAVAALNSLLRELMALAAREFGIEELGLLYQQLAALSRRDPRLARIEVPGVPRGQSS